MQISWKLSCKMIQLPIVYVASKHSIPTQVCLDPSTQNQSKHHNNHFNIQTNQKTQKENHAKAGKYTRVVQQFGCSFCSKALEHDSKVLRNSNMSTQTNLPSANSSLHIRSDIKLDGRKLVNNLQERKQQRVRPNAAAFFYLGLDMFGHENSNQLH